MVLKIIQFAHTHTYTQTCYDIAKTFCNYFFIQNEKTLTFWRRKWVERFDVEWRETCDFKVNSMPCQLPALTLFRLIFRVRNQFAMVRDETFVNDGPGLQWPIDMLSSSETKWNKILDRNWFILGACKIPCKNSFLQITFNELDVSHSFLVICMELSAAQHWHNGFWRSDQIRNPFSQ